MTRLRHMVGTTFLIALIVGAEPAAAAPTVTGFSATPSTTRAGGHPDLNVSTGFSEPVTLSGVALHLPAGLRAKPQVFAFCSRKRLRANLCPRNSKVGSITVVAVAYGFELPVTRKIYNVRPRSTDLLRFGVPIIGSASSPGVAVEVPVTERPQDKGLDVALAGLPAEVAGVAVRVNGLRLFLRGMSRTRVGKRVRKRAFLTNPNSCAPATTTLDLTLHPATTLTASSSFTPTACS